MTKVSLPGENMLRLVTDLDSKIESWAFGQEPSSSPTRKSNILGIVLYKNVYHNVPGPNCKKPGHALGNQSIRKLEQ